MYINSTYIHTYICKCIAHTCINNYICKYVVHTYVLTFLYTVHSTYIHTCLFSLYVIQDASTILRCISNQKQRGVFYRDSHPHLVVDKMKFEDEQNGFGTLKVSGYIRGRTLSVNGLVHLPKYGAFQMSQVCFLTELHHVFVLAEAVLVTPVLYTD